MIYVRQARQEPHFCGTIHPIRPLSIAVAVDQNGGFGKDGKIPWHFKEDFQHFKETTKDSICIMGRKTYEDMLEMVKARQKKKKVIKEILPGRKCFVLTRQEDYKAEGAEVVSSLLEAVQNIDEDDTRPVFVLGGEKLFIESLPWVNTLHMTVIQDCYNCDRFFPVDYVKEKFTAADGRVGENDKLLFIEYARIKE